MAVLPVIHSTNMAPVAVENESDLATLPTRTYQNGTTCFANSSQTIFVWDSLSTAITVTGVSVAVATGGAWIAIGSAAGAINIDTVVGAGDSLKNIIPVSDVTATVKGYYAAGDSGGGLFYWDATSVATDNGGTIIRPTLAVIGAWIRILEFEFLNVKWFGASPTAVTDNAPLFAAAINALPKQGAAQLGAIYVPGDLPYPFTTSLTISAGADNGFEALRIFGDVGGVTSNRGTRIRWDGALSGTVISVLGVTNVFFNNIDVDCNSRAKFGYDVKADVGPPIRGTSNIQWANCSVFSPRDVAGAACWSFGEATGAQCDNLTWERCTAQGTGGNVNIVGFIGQGGANVKDVTWNNCFFSTLIQGLNWNTPSGRNSMRSPAFTSITDTCLLFNEGTLVVESGNTESCTGYLLRSTASGGASATVTFIGGQYNITCGADDMVCKWRAGFQVYIGCYFRNLRTGASVPNIVVDNAYSYANANNFGLKTIGCTFINAAGPYIPVLDQAGATILTTAVLQGANGQAPIFSEGDLGGPLAGLSKLRPIGARIPDYPSKKQGIIVIDANGVLTVANGADIGNLPADTNLQIGGNVQLRMQAATIQLGNTTATQTLNLNIASIAGANGVFGTPFTQFKIVDQVTLETYANGTRVFRADATGIGLYANATVAQQQVTDNTTGVAATQLVDVTTAGLADPVKINNNFATLLTKLQTLGALRN